jgi:hypothetical protein
MIHADGNDRNPQEFHTTLPQSRIERVRFMNRDC